MKKTKFVNVQIDDQELKVLPGTTIFQAAQQAGIDIPHLCYHPAFEPEGSCRMCLIEIEGLPKLELACSTIVREGMKVLTNSPDVINARKGVLEFILAEHPLDCPICDKAGECKLQDYYEDYGLFPSRFLETKEKKRKKISIGQHLILDQERCVLCTRCVRFLREVTKTGELGVFQRGLKSEVDILGDQTVDNNYSGNLGDICPVGAITDKDFRFQTRSWFLKNRPSICPLCSRGCNISIEYHEGFALFPSNKRVYRIKARENPDINGYWICDHGRYDYNYIDKNRLDKIAQNIDDRKKIFNWDESVKFLSNQILRLVYRKRTDRITLILNSNLTNEELFLIHRFFLKELKVSDIFFADPPSGEADSVLLTEERSSNRRGALEMGYDPKPLNLQQLPERTELLFIFGSFNEEMLKLSEFSDVLKNIPMKIFITTHQHELIPQMDLVLPGALVPEKSGSLTNTQGMIQSFLPVFDPPGEARPEWQTLVHLARETGINFKYFAPLSRSEEVFRKLENEIKFFRKNK